MRTPIQELIEQLYTMYYKALTIETDLSRTGLSNAICLAESMLEKEKEQIMDAWMDDRFPLDKDWVKQCAEQYYNETFNTKEK